jgi:tRNA G10  N-methylase Trm11
LIKSIHLKTADILDKPELGAFDVITSDLPFGMQVSKGEDLAELYRTFVSYSEEVLKPEGILVTYTTEHELLSEMLKESKFSIIQTLDLKVSTVTNAYIHPKIFVCKRTP